MLITELKFEKVFKIAMMSLRINRSHPGIVRNIKFWITQFIPIMMLSIMSSILLINSFLLHDIPAGKYAEASKNGTMLIVSITITFKYITLLYYQNSLKYFINIIDDDYESAKDLTNEEKVIVLKYAKKGVTVCKFWLVSGFATSAIFPIKALVLTCYYYWNGERKLIPMFDLTYLEPFESRKDYLPVFCFLFLFCLSFDCYATTMYIGFDPLVPIFMLHTCGQLELLSRRIVKLFEDCDNPRMIEDQLKLIVLKLQKLYRFVENVKSNYVILYEYNMKTTTFLLPLTAFQILEDLQHGSINIEFISFFTGVILHFYMPCYYSVVLMEKSERFRQAVYSCGWEKQHDKRVRQIILFMMTRATTPLVITTIFYSVSLDTFAEMCRHSYAIFNLMNAGWS